MEKKRNRFDIIFDMLSAIQDKGGRIKPTHLMYKANLAHRQLKLYLDELIEKDFVVKETKKEGDFYLITENGIKYLKKIYEMKEFEKTFGI